MRMRCMVRAAFIATMVLAMVACGDEADEAEDAARDTATTVAKLWRTRPV